MEAFGTARAFRRGDTLLREGDRGAEMYVIRSGKVRVFRGSGATEVTLAVLGPGEYLGEMALVGDHPRSATAVAEMDTDVTVIDRDTFRAFVSEPIVLDIIRRMAERIRDLDEAVTQSERADTARRAHLASTMQQRHWFT